MKLNKLIKFQLKIALMGILISILTSVAPLWGTSNAVSYLENGVGARSKAMAGSHVAIVNDGYAGYWNPAGLGRLTASEINAMQTQIWGVIEQKYYGFASPLIGNSGISISYLEATVSDILVSDDQGNMTGETFGYKGSTVLASLGCSLDFFGGFMRGHYIGLTAKFIQETLYNNSAKGKEIDIGWMLRVIDKGWIGLQVQNILPEKIIWDTDSKTEEEIPMSITLGVGYMFFDNLNLSIDLRLKEKRRIIQHVGVEWNILDNKSFKCFLRGGFKQEKAAFGLGILFNNFSLDYAYDFGPNEYIESSNWVSVGYRFSMMGKPIEN